MSVIRVDNFGPSAGGTTYSARGIAKAWVNFNGTGTIAARDSENVSSLTDNGTGDYTVNFSNAFGAADYSIVTGTEDISGGSNSQFLTLTTTSVEVYTVKLSPLGLNDIAIVTAAINGDLA